MSLIWPIITQAATRLRETAVVDDQRRYTFGQLLGGAMHLAEQIDATTSAPHVGIMLAHQRGVPDCPYSARGLARRVAVPLNYLLSPEELAYVIHDSDIDTVITAGPMLDFLSSNSSGESGGGGSARQTIPGDAQRQIFPPGIRVMRMESLGLFRRGPASLATDA